MQVRQEPHVEQRADLGDLVRQVLRSTCHACDLLSLQAVVPTSPPRSVAVGGTDVGLGGPLSVWRTVVPPHGLAGEVVLIAAARRRTSAARTAVLATGELVRELIDSDLRRQLAETAAVQAAEMAGSDPLTDLGNRRTWRRALDAEAARLRRYPSTATVVVVDLDDLKLVNDQQGHAACDELLLRAAEAVRRAARRVDVVCRLGGDEFGVLAPSTDRTGAAVLVDRVRDELQRAGVPASVGAATTDLGDLDAAWQAADAAMYADKRRDRTG
jgi:diguanylate cyclase (GGDEF)-like protein